MKAFVVKFFRLNLIVIKFKGKKFKLIFVPAVAVIQNELTIIVITKFKRYVDGLLLKVI